MVEALAHFQTGVKVFVALYIFISIGSIINMLCVMWIESVVAVLLAEAAILLVVLVIVALCTIYALINKKHAFLWAFIIVTVRGAHSLVRKRN
jgi:hypothetical protein